MYCTVRMLFFIPWNAYIIGFLTDLHGSGILLHCHGVWTLASCIACLITLVCSDVLYSPTKAGSSCFLSFFMLAFVRYSTNRFLLNEIITATAVWRGRVGDQGRIIEPRTMMEIEEVTIEADKPVKPPCRGSQRADYPDCTRLYSVTAQSLNAALIPDVDQRHHASKQRKHQAQPHNPWIKTLSVL